MENHKQIAETLQKIATGKAARPPIFIATVSATSGDTCQATIGELTLTDIRLAAPDQAAQHILVTPSVGSQIAVADLSGGEMRSLIAIAYSDIDSVKIKNGRNGGLVNIRALTAYLDALQSSISAALAAIGVGPAASGTVAQNLFDTLMQSPSQNLANTIEDPTFTH